MGDEMFWSFELVVLKFEREKNQPRGGDDDDDDDDESWGADLA